MMVVCVALQRFYHKIEQSNEVSYGKGMGMSIPWQER
jgi:hypothetical protein